jgi:AGZA family xanthine/uracil permease-like MFS transporter
MSIQQTLTDEVDPAPRTTPGPASASTTTQVPSPAEAATRRRTPGRPAGTPEAPQAPSRFLDRVFHISQRGSTVSREIRGGLVTFFTMAYIVVLNPLILGGFSATSAPTDVTGAFLPAA